MALSGEQEIKKKLRSTTKDILPKTREERGLKSNPSGGLLTPVGFDEPG